jgi:hypothetical protein
MKKVKLLLVLMLISLTMSGYAQVTTSSMSGRVTDERGALIGATVKAVHGPSGTAYGVVTNSEGRYTIQGMRTGGPYLVEILYLGFSDFVQNNVYLQLGETYVLNARLSESETLVEEVLVTGLATKFTTEKTGPSTNINNEQMRLLPSINRSISDIARLSPYANGMSFSGGDGRSSNFTVDGANLNNNFGLNPGLPGGGNPISVDAIEEVQVVIAPFDVRQTNFIGGGVNAITKSGTNTFKGSAYTYFQNQDMRGNRIGDRDFGERDKESNTVYGATLGGPIIKNKLFFFGNVEYEKSPQQVVNWRASTNGVTDHQTISRTTEADLKTVSDFLKANYGYDTGSYTDFPADVSNLKYLIRLDWNINDANKVSLRYNHTKNRGWNPPNDNSTDGSYRDNSKKRISEWSMSYANSMYSTDNVVNSATAELNSRLNETMSNQLLATYSLIKDVRGSTSALFPFIDIMSGDIATGASALDPYISAGYEPFTWNNEVTNKITTITDNFTYYYNNHKITAGLSYEYQYANNNYMRSGTGYYRYASLSDFLNNAAPVDFALTYGANGNKLPSNAVAFGQFGGYVQDEWNVLDNLKLTAGVRADNLSFLNEIMTNNAIKNVDFGGRHIDTGVWPKSRINWSPRLGVTYDALKDKTLILRGGTGLFTGRLPLVFFTNMPSNAGMNQMTMKLQTRFNADGTVASRDPLLDQLAGPIITNVDEMIARLGFQTTVTPEQGSKPSSIAGVDPNFKMPQVWKTSLGVDYTIPIVAFPFTVTAEGTYTKNINAVTQINYAVKDPENSWEKFTGPDNRYIYPSGNDRYLAPGTSDACVLSNTNKGHGYTLNLTLKAEPVNNLNLMAAYTHTEMKEISGMPGSNANSAWVNIYSVNGPNHSDIQRSQYVIPNQVIGSISYTLPDRDYKATTISLFYRGYSPYGDSFLYSNDMNGDGVTGDLIYIPKKRGDVNFISQADEDAFFAFMAQDSYLKKHKGQYAEAYSSRAPWVHKFDLRILQDFYIKIGGDKHNFQLNFDILNVGNMLNSKWGVNKNMAASNYGKVLKYEGKDANNTPSFSMVKINGEYPTKTYDTYLNYGQCWNLQVGLRYIFN